RLSLLRWIVGTCCCRPSVQPPACHCSTELSRPTRYRAPRPRIDRPASASQGLKTYWVGPIVYVKLETNQGISGWGDLKGVDPRPAKALVESLFELLKDEN